MTCGKCGYVRQYQAGKCPKCGAAAVAAPAAPEDCADPRSAAGQFRQVAPHITTICAIVAVIVANVPMGKPVPWSLRLVLIVGAIAFGLLLRKVGERIFDPQR